MSLQYQAVFWNPAKRRYDSILAAGVSLYLALFIGVSASIHPAATAETMIIRATSTAALLLLHVILCIGPLCRLSPRFLPLLYNRRHLGVTMFLLALVHSVLSIFQFHALGDVNPMVSVLVSNTRFGSLRDFPFEVLGLGALVILFLMAASSHDFWLSTLSPRIWKRLHMGVYVAYGLLIGHVSLGALQSETNPVLVALLGSGAMLVIGLHLGAGLRERRIDGQVLCPAEDRFIEVCRAADIPEKRAKVVSVGGERVAVFRYDGKVAAISNVCQHQNGPLGEGRIIEGCVTCPWHGYQYIPETGASPPPFLERVPTFQTRVVSGTVFVDPRPYPAGTRLEPSRLA
jgi:sulfoxide reductase heme-binding subunit YedZ